jgi:two-component system response regulator PilR (NtrC family)
MEQILVVDDEQSMREFLAILLKKEGYEVAACADVPAARKALSRSEFDLVVTDLKIPGGTGLDVLGAAKEARPGTEVLVITAFGTAETAVEAMKRGAYDYLTKPFKVEEIKITIQKALEKAALARENRELRQRLEATEAGGEILGRSPPMQAVFRILDRVAPTGVTVLVYGESGTGKELVARRLHALSGRPGPFVAVNCSAIPDGLMESETLFLDEVGELPLHLQPKLLRVLQEGKVKRVGGTREVPMDVRIVSSTNRALREEVEEGRFREDLYYRLNVVALSIPPLRDRREDIPLLVHHFLKKYSMAFGRPILGLTREALEVLEGYDFPGNVRELENAMERAVALETEDYLSSGSLPEQLRGTLADEPLNMPSIPDEGVDLEALLQSVERRYLDEALRRVAGNKTEASKLLRLTFRSFRYRLDKLGMSPSRDSSDNR